MTWGGLGGFAVIKWTENFTVRDGSAENAVFVGSAVEDLAGAVPARLCCLSHWGALAVAGKRLGDGAGVRTTSRSAVESVSPRVFHHPASRDPAGGR